ncbi:MAG: hypothetical protein ACI9JO_000859, partial [Psychrobacter okhotskensis]
CFYWAVMSRNRAAQSSNQVTWIYYAQFEHFDLAKSSKITTSLSTIYKS